MKDRYLCKAKRIDNGEWVQGIPFEIEGKMVILTNDDEKIYSFEANMRNVAIYAIEVNPSTICQCTGLKGKNGDLIWENDILSYQRDNDDCPFPNKDTKKRLGKVFYKGFRTTFAIGMGKNGSGSINNDLWKYVQNGNRVEVIGNIFDNPELLEDEKVKQEKEDDEYDER